MTAHRWGAALGVVGLALVAGCGGGAEKRTVPGPSRTEAVAAIQVALPDIEPAGPSNGAAFEKLLKACIAIARVDQQEQAATSPSLSAKERSELAHGKLRVHHRRRPGADVVAAARSLAAASRRGYIPGIGKHSRTSMAASGMCKCGWSSSSFFAASGESASTIE